MIVKNEAHVIRRCLASVKPWIDYWVIVDTGSSDGTQTIIQEYLQDIPGELHQRPWVNFGHNRSEAIQLAANKADYLFVIDADEVLELSDDFVLPNLNADAYQLTVHYSGQSYARTCLVASRLEWRYIGVLHEYLHTDHPFSTDSLTGATINVFPDGGRGLNISQRQKYLADAEILETALTTEPDNARYVFYLAQSYRDAQEPEQALIHYQRRSQMGGWGEEVWYALYQVALLSEQLNLDQQTILGRYLQAYQYRPQRAEALYQLARFCRLTENHHLAHLFAGKAIDIARPEDRLFLDESVYQWRCLDEYAIACYWVGEFAQSEIHCQTLLNSSQLPVAEQTRIASNLAFAQQAQTP